MHIVLFFWESSWQTCGRIFSMVSPMNGLTNELSIVVVVVWQWPHARDERA
jgi:hypothetical protein